MSLDLIKVADDMTPDQVEACADTAKLLRTGVNDRAIDPGTDAKNNNIMRHILTHAGVDQSHIPSAFTTEAIVAFRNRYQIRLSAVKNGRRIAEIEARTMNVDDGEVQPITVSALDE